ncbi:MAG: thiamine-phosphate kinase, partial [Planctomycetes bacterium]|nr:thiamine-phosphate kinase [Planctomycetota bacterium]
MELEFLQWLRGQVPENPLLSLGLSDDAAVLSLAGRADLVVTTDLLSEGVDFELAVNDPRQIGRKAIAVNLSDLAAMAARPLAALASIAIPRRPANGQSSLELAIAIYEGLLLLAKEFDVAIAGGDTNTHDGPLVINITAIGQVTNRGPLTRSGGRPGDWLLVTSVLGGSILGHHYDFTPRVRESLLLHQKYNLHAGMDLSDGLAIDLARLAVASNCGAVTYVDRLPIAPGAWELAQREAPDRTEDLAVIARQHALGDGEDFELLLTAPPDVARTILQDQPVSCGITHV